MLNCTLSVRTAEWDVCVIDARIKITSITQTSHSPHFPYQQTNNNDNIIQFIDRESSTWLRVPTDSTIQWLVLVWYDGWICQAIDWLVDWLRHWLIVQFAKLEAFLWISDISINKLCTLVMSLFEWDRSTCWMIVRLVDVDDGVKKDFDGSFWQIVDWLFVWLIDWFLG